MYIIGTCEGCGNEDAIDCVSGLCVGCMEKDQAPIVMPVANPEKEGYLRGLETALLLFGNKDIDEIRTSLRNAIKQAKLVN